ncbi:MAG: HAD-IA family hydrolase [Bacteroidaceae bacterium]|nr:HAD-IA family hydrolase [Bacteroidaceae bacterium]
MTASLQFLPEGESSIRRPSSLGGGQAKAILFDMDGVLFDSMPNYAYSWSHAMTQFGLAMTAEEAYMNEGRTGSGTIDILAQRFWGRSATEEEKQRIYAAKSALFNTLPEARPMPGAWELLQLVKQAGKRIVLVTGSAQVSLLGHLEHHFPGCFRKELMVTAFDVKHGKPHPEPYLMGLQKAGIEASEAIVVENAPLGVEAAHAAGIFTLAVNTGPLPDDILRQSGADVVLPDMFAAAKFLEARFQEED